MKNKTTAKNILEGFDWSVKVRIYTFSIVFHVLRTRLYYICLIVDSFIGQAVRSETTATAT